MGEQIKELFDDICDPLTNKAGSFQELHESRSTDATDSPHMLYSSGVLMSAMQGKVQPADL